MSEALAAVGEMLLYDHARGKLDLASFNKAYLGTFNAIAVFYGYMDVFVGLCHFFFLLS